jgi:hypothetical protein
MDTISYEEALVHFQAQGPFWVALCEGIRARREVKFGDLKRNMETPNCNQKADDKTIGAMLECDDILYEFETEWELEETAV